MEAALRLPRAEGDGRVPRLRFRSGRRPRRRCAATVVAVSPASTGRRRWRGRGRHVLVSHTSMLSTVTVLPRSWRVVRPTSPPSRRGPARRPPHRLRPARTGPHPVRRAGPRPRRDRRRRLAAVALCQGRRRGAVTAGGLKQATCALGVEHGSTALGRLAAGAALQAGGRRPRAQYSRRGHRRRRHAGAKPLGRSKRDLYAGTHSGWSRSPAACPSWLDLRLTEEDPAYVAGPRTSWRRAGRFDRAAAT